VEGGVKKTYCIKIHAAKKDEKGGHGVSQFRTLGRYRLAKKIRIDRGGGGQAFYSRTLIK